MTDAKFTTENIKAMVLWGTYTAAAQINPVDDLAAAEKLFDRWLANHENKVRTQIIKELQDRLPALLTADAENPHGWLSDGFENITTDANRECISYHGEGSIDLNHLIDNIVSSIEQNN